jgi:glycosyltransferase involved in cell wall biosynthesis
VSRLQSERFSVVHVLAPADVGGIESVVRLLAAGQRRRGHDVLVAPLVSDVGSRAAWIASVRETGVPVEPLVARRRRYVAEWRAVSELLRARRPAIVHTHGYRADVLAGLSARRLGFPVVATVHGFIGVEWKHRLYERLQCRVLRGFDAVMPVSRAMAGQLHQSGVPSDRLHVVTNAFEAHDRPLARAEARRRLAIGDEEFRVGWIGRLSPEKGADVIIRALALLPGDVQLSILGDGAERRRLEVLSRDLGVAGRVTWHGTQPNAAVLASAFDAITLSSRSEGTPIVLFEAIAAGTPVVATRVGGVPEVVSDTEALLVPAEDPSALARAIDTVRADVVAAATRAAAAMRRLASDFAVGPWITRVDEVYATAQRRRSGPRAR